MNRLLFVFLDGVGLGSSDPAVNPFVAAHTPFLDELLGGRLDARLAEWDDSHVVVRRLDARLGCDGLPQSATGQTTLLTGRNGAELMGRHYGPWPGPTLKAELDKGTLFSETWAVGRSCAFLNAYPPGYFSALERGQRRVNVPVYAALAAGLELRTLEDYARAEAVSADLTGAYLHELDPALPTVSEAEAGGRLAALAGDHDFSFFDYWLSDSAGHRWGWQASLALVEGLDRFFSGLIPALGNATLLVTSDHGNLEDKSTRTHTLNSVPLIAVGPGARVFAESSSLLDVAPAIQRLLSLHPKVSAK